MNAEHDRDRVLDQALKQARGAGDGAPVTAACLDAETLAAWVDGGLDASSLAMAEAHASSCARCQALIGTMARIPPAAIAGTEGRARLWRWWFAPLAAGAAAATLWMVVPSERQSATPAAPVAEVAQSTPAAAAEPASGGSKDPPLRSRRAGSSDPAGPIGDLANTNRAADVETSAESSRKAEAPPRADKPVETLGREARVAEEQAAAAPPVSQLQMQVDPPIDAQITARSSPSSTVTWFVGRAGMVLLTVDGRTFTRVPFPEATDLTAVTATDARIAVVTTVDGRTFRTEDAGRNWRRQ